MDQAVTITFVPEQVLAWLIIGLVAGLLAGSLVRGRRMSLTGSILVGLVGALVGGLLFSFLNVQVSPALAQPLNIRWIDIIVAFLGALLVLILVGGLFGWRRI
jgi:uncharacterized membrane protein YeaQ/YmgE (transglycosylase-associated protein family)